MVKRGEIVDLGGLWREGHGLSEGSDGARPLLTSGEGSPTPSDADW